MRPTLMLLPGLMCDAAVWAPQVKALKAQLQAHCVVPDWGLRDSLTAMAQQVLEMAPTERFSMAGHSMGGRVALQVMRLAPQRVERLALLDTGTHPLAAGEAGAKERAGRMALLELARTQGMRAMGRQWARGMVHPSRLDTPLFESILDMLERSNPEQFAAQINALLNRPDAAALLPTITCPTLVLCGREDGWSTPAQHEAMHAAIPNSILRIIEHSGHMCTMEQPQAVSEALADWLAQSAA
jgi:pimeloyl-ACP methyl ester carboxylesterase